MMAQAGSTAGADPVLARAHHGSVSKDQRALIEDDLKSGRLRCVVATSSLELGIDMGAVDLVVQVESPPSVASGLQRVGRAGHQVGEISQGVLFPKHRADLVHTAITVERMLGRQDRTAQCSRQPAGHPGAADRGRHGPGRHRRRGMVRTVRRSAPFASLPRSAFEATLDLLAGRYPSDEFAELRPRIIWDRNAGTIEGRPGAQRLAVTSGGTIPDRGLFGVYIIGTEVEGSASPSARGQGCQPGASAAKGGRRVGELDEEMVYESRVGDVFALGATSWKIEDITHDRVLVSPAFGQPGKLPFWKGDSLGRPVDLGRALGAFVRELSASDVGPATERCKASGLDDFAANNLIQYLAEQKQATEVVPSDTTLVVERFHDELGDWRVVLHSPFGMPVHAPWALAVGQRLHQRYGLDGSAMAADDGIVLRVPMMEDEPPGAELFLFEPGGTGADRHGRGGRQRPLRLALPRMRRPGTAAAPAEPGQAAAAVAAAPTVGPAAGCGPEVPDVSHRAGNRPRMPAGRLRPAGAEGHRSVHRAARTADRRRPPPSSPHRSPSPCCSATSPSSSTRATPRWRSAGPPRWPWTPPC